MQRKFFRETILRGPSDRVRRRLSEIVTEVALSELRAVAAEGAGAEGDPLPEETGRARAVAGAFLAVATWWLEDARNLTPEEVDAVFQGAVAGAS